MLKLLMRFYDVQKGAILINGHDIRDFCRKDLRALFGMVLQDTWLFNGTLIDNIRNADLILVVCDGNIVEQGTHAKLLSRNGFYVELYNIQFQ